MISENTIYLLDVASNQESPVTLMSFAPTFEHAQYWIMY